MRTSSLLLLVNLFLVTGLFAQTDQPLAALDALAEPKAAPVLADRFMPALADGSLLDLINSQVNYPEIAVENGVEGTVVLELSVGADGSIRQSRVVRSVSLLDQAALDAVTTLPDLLPAVENGQAVARRLYIPLRFRLR